MRGNLFIVGSAASGTGKSEGVKPIILPLKSFEGRPAFILQRDHLSELVSKKRRGEKRLGTLERDLSRKNCKNAILDENAALEEHKALIAELVEIDKSWSR